MYHKEAPVIIETINGASGATKRKHRSIFNVGIWNFTTSLTLSDAERASTVFLTVLFGLREVNYKILRMCLKVISLKNWILWMKLS